MPDVYKIGDLVWAKMKGFPPWPGRVSNPPKDLKRPASKKASHCIYFFGSENYGWIEESNLKPYEQYKEALIRANKSNAFKDAVEAIEKCAQNKGDESFSDESDSVFDRLIESSSSNSNSEKKPKPKTQKKTNKEDSDSVFDRLIDSDNEKKTKPKSHKKENAGKIIVKREYGSSGGSAAKRIKKDKKEDLEVTTNGDDHLASSFSPLRKGPGSNLLDRPANVTRPETPPLDLESVSQTLKEKNILPSTLKFGFLGLGIMGSGIVKNLLNSGHSVIVWNRTPDKE
ncbi:cytokine-like nuclear factor N-PAC [Macrosteles quadrilineatus]|uniref:cytokine-like nuclear factor N-PAC n=1 Tax=Macrosteles quadrilineatus TaxID=74068 RepID=UPI0023E17D30|nr:cytokine-like nuclear factor N-PAC [Macrosteles quadrilineatus]